MHILSFFWVSYITIIWIFLEVEVGDLVEQGGWLLDFTRSLLMGNTWAALDLLYIFKALV